MYYSFISKTFPFALFYLTLHFAQIELASLFIIYLLLLTGFNYCLHRSDPRWMQIFWSKLPRNEKVDVNIIN